MDKIRNNKVMQDPFQETNIVAVIVIAGMFLVGFAFLYYVFVA